jgi:pimeloyl-ACP methyl ester carboxylesterase
LIFFAHFEACAKDIETFCDYLGKPAEVVLGHSFGGKVAMVYQQLAANKPKQVLTLTCCINHEVWVLDSMIDPQLPETDPSDKNSVPRVTSPLALP